MEIVEIGGRDWTKVEEVGEPHWMKIAVGELHWTKTEEEIGGHHWMKIEEIGDTDYMKLNSLTGRSGS